MVLLARILFMRPVQPARKDKPSYSFSNDERKVRARRRRLKYHRGPRAPACTSAPQTAVILFIIYRTTELTARRTLWPHCPAHSSRGCSPPAPPSTHLCSPLPATVPTPAAGAAAKRKLHAEAAEDRAEAAFWANWQGPPRADGESTRPSAAERMGALRQRIRAKES